MNNLLDRLQTLMIYENEYHNFLMKRFNWILNDFIMYMEKVDEEYNRLLLEIDNARINMLISKYNQIDIRKQGMVKSFY